MDPCAIGIKSTSTLPLGITAPGHASIVLGCSGCAERRVAHVRTAAERIVERSRGACGRRLPRVDRGLQHRPVLGGLGGLASFDLVHRLASPCKYRA